MSRLREERGFEDFGQAMTRAGCLVLVVGAAAGILAVLLLTYLSRHVQILWR